MRQLRDRVAIVTGASSGLGWQTAYRLAEQGMRLCITARREEPLEKLARELNRVGADALFVPADVTIDADVNRVVRTCLDHYGRLDLLVNNAAVQSYAYFERYNWQEIQRVMDVNFYGYLRFAREVLPYFRERDDGHIINVCSMLSRGAAPLLSAYTASKHAILGWSDSLRLELYRTNIDVSAILVPSIATPMFDHAPTQLGVLPKPVPPTYDVDFMARKVVKLARRPRARYIPVNLQGSVLLWMQQLAPFIGDGIMGRWGVPLQMGKRPVHRTEGNLYKPIPDGVGPYGSALPQTGKPTLFAAGAMLFALAGGAALGAAGLSRAMR